MRWARRPEPKEKRAKAPTKRERQTLAQEGQALLRACAAFRCPPARHRGAVPRQTLSPPRADKTAQAHCQQQGLMKRPTAPSSL